MNAVKPTGIFYLLPFMCIAAPHVALANELEPTENAQRVAVVMNTPGCVAFWDFVKREPDGERRFIAHTSQDATNNYALDAGNYVKDYWGEGRTGELESTKRKQPQVTWAKVIAAANTVLVNPRWQGAIFKEEQVRRGKGTRTFFLAY